MRAFSALNEKYPFCGNYVQKIKILISSWNLIFKLTLNLHRSIVMFTFSVLEWKYAFLANLLQKIKIVISNWNFVFRPIWIYRNQQWCLVLCFRAEILLLGKLGRKNENCCLKLKFNILANLNMQNSIVMLTFFALDPKYPF